MKSLYIILTFLPAFLSGGPARNSIDSYIAETFSCKDFRNASASILAVTAGGDTLACYGSDKMMIPASNMKIVTTALALHSLGGDYKYETSIGYNGCITEDGTLKGDLYIVGGGDPTIGSKDSIAVALETTFGRWAKIIKDAGIKKIDGYIIGDGRFFSGIREHSSWQYDDIGTYYGAGTSGLSFYENMISFKVSAGEKTGDPVKISQSYPDTPWMEIRYDCHTGKAGTGNTLYFYTSDLAPVGEMRGTFALDRQPKTEDAANKFPEYTCAYYFTEYLKTCKIPCTKGAADLGNTFGIPKDKICPKDSLTILGSTLSPSLARIAYETNHASNNLYAETLMKTIGKEYCGSGCYESSQIAVQSILKEIGVSDTGIQICDGSGLSRSDYASAGFFCDLLNAMMSSPSFEDFVSSLPYPGGKGTLQFQMKSVPYEKRWRIRMKSGSMGGVRCLSGYIIPKSGSKEDAIIFSILVNNFTCPYSKIQARMENIIEMLAGLN